MFSYEWNIRGLCWEVRLGRGCHWLSSTDWGLGVSWARSSILNVEVRKISHPLQNINLHCWDVFWTSRFDKKLYEPTPMPNERPPPPPFLGNATGSLTTFPSTPCPNLHPHPNHPMFHPTSPLHPSCSRALHVNLSLGPFTPCSLLIKSFCSLHIPPKAYNVDRPERDQHTSILHHCSYPLIHPPILCSAFLIIRPSWSNFCWPLFTILIFHSSVLIPLPVCTCCHVPFHRLALVLGMTLNCPHKVIFLLHRDANYLSCWSAVKSPTLSLSRSLFSLSLSPPLIFSAILQTKCSPKSGHRQKCKSERECTAWQRTICGDCGYCADCGIRYDRVTDKNDWMFDNIYTENIQRWLSKTDISSMSYSKKKAETNYTLDIVCEIVWNLL